MLILLFGMQSLLDAGITGNIRGHVTDATSNESLSGANVIITKVWINGQEQSFDENLGAACDVAGEFIILNISPGVYTVEASMIGYASSAQQNVRVSAAASTALVLSVHRFVWAIASPMQTKKRGVATTKAKNPKMFMGSSFSHRGSTAPSAYEGSGSSRSSGSSAS